MPCLSCEPPIELLAAAVARRRRRLVAARRLPRGTGEADMEVVVVPPPRPDLSQPAAVRTRLMAQLPLDRRVNKNARHLRLARECFEQATVLRGPRLVDLISVGSGDIGRRHVLALADAEPSARHWGEPDVGVEADLMRAVPGQHRPAARLGDVADEETGPIGSRRQLWCDTLQECDQRRVTPGAVA